MVGSLVSLIVGSLTSNNLQKSAANREFSIFDKIPLKDITVMFPSQKIRKNSHQKSESLEN